MLPEKATLAKEFMSFFERLKTAASAEWRLYTEHPFTEGMADGSLAEAAFRHYLVQDYLFLIEFARAYALSVYKSPTLADMREAAGGLSAILDVEMNLHVKLCAGWGLSATDLEQAPPAVEMLAYTRYVLDAGMRGDLLALKVALAPCVIGYAEIATRLAARPDALAATNPYRVWIAEYAGGPIRRSRRKRGSTWKPLPIATPRRRARQSWSRSSRKPPGSKPTSGKWAGARASVERSLAAYRVGKLWETPSPASPDEISRFAPEPHGEARTASRRSPQGDLLYEKGGRSLNQPVSRHDAYGVAHRHIEPVKCSL